MSVSANMLMLGFFKSWGKKAKSTKANNAHHVNAPPLTFAPDGMLNVHLRGGYYDGSSILTDSYNRAVWVCYNLSKMERYKLTEINHEARCAVGILSSL